MLLKELEQFVDQDNALYYSELKQPEYLIQIFDKDEKSDYYFYIKDHKRVIQHGQSVQNVHIEYKPRSNESTESSERWIGINTIKKHVSNWVELLNEYNKTRSFYDDTILKAYEEEYFNEFSEVIENTEDYEKPFTIKQQLALDTLFTNLKIELTNQSKDKPDEVVKSIELIKEEITDLQESVHDKTKAKVITTLSKIYAKISKLGISFIKAFGNEVQKQIIKSIIDGTVDYTKFLN